MQHSPQGPVDKDAHSIELFREMIETIPQMVWSVLPNGEIEFVNRQWTDYSGLSLEQTRRGEWKNVLHPDDRDRFIEAWDEAIEQQTPLEQEARFCKQDRKVYFWHLARSQPIRDAHGNIIRWFGSTTNIDRARRATENLRFLNRASAELSASLDYEVTLQRVVQSVVPEIADWCALDMVTADGSIKRLAVAHKDPEKVKFACELVERYPPSPDDVGGVYETVRTRQSQLIEVIPPELLRSSARDAEHLKLIESLEIESAISVPLIADNDVLGVLTLILSESRRHFNQDDLEFAEELARSAALAIRNSRLYKKAEEEIEQRRLAERKLARGERQFTSLIESNLIGVIFSNNVGDIYYANQAFLEIVGRTKKEVEGGNLNRQMLTPEEDLKFYPEAIAQLESEGFALPYEKRFIHSDGRIVFTLLSTAYLDGNPDQVVSFVLDLTAIRHAEEARREIAEQHRLIAETASDAIFTIDEQSNVLYANHAASRIFGYEKESLIGQKLDVIMPEYLRKLHYAGVERYTKTGKKHIPWSGVELPALHRDGHEFPVDVSFGEFKRDGKHVFVGYVRDISERRRVEKELAISEVRFRTMIEQSPLSIQVFSRDGRCIQANKAWEDLWGGSRDELTHYNILKDEQLQSLGMMEFVQRAFEGHSVDIPPLFYVPRRHPENGRWIRAYLYPVSDEGGDLREVALIMEDITTPKLAAEELERAKKEAEAANEAKDRFLAVLSHELRTPLTPILTTVQALGMDEDIPEDLKPWLEIIERNVQLEARLIDDLLDLTRISKGKLPLAKKDIDAHKLIEQVLDIFREETGQKKIELTVDLKAEFHCMHADPARIQQIFWNLLRNAIKFTSEGGRVSVCTSNPRKDVLRLEVSDTGIGIEPTIINRIFDPFEQGEQSITRHFGGLGLGLAISKLLAEMHEGRLSAASPGKDKGATFSVELPAMNLKGLESGGVVAKQIAKRSTAASILMVDDHVDTSRVLCRLLDRRGYRTKVVHSVREALDYAKDNEFDLLISDIGLPDGSGLDLVQQIKVLRPNVHAIAMSGYGTEQDVERSIEAGFELHLIKPFDFPKLQQAVQELVG